MSRAASSSRPPPPKATASETNGKGRARDDVIRTKILLLGMRRQVPPPSSGKTSIREVLFNDLSPRETLYLETTTHLVKHTYDTVIPLEIWDCPGDTTLDTLDAPLTQFATMIFVIDIQSCIISANLRFDRFGNEYEYKPILSAHDRARIFRVTSAPRTRHPRTARALAMWVHVWQTHPICELHRILVRATGSPSSLIRNAGRDYVRSNGPCLLFDDQWASGDSQTLEIDLYQQPIQKLVDFVTTAYEKNSNMNLEVFVHKADVLTEEYRIDNFRHIQQRVLSDLTYINFEYEQIPINFQLTSIYDHSLHDAFSRVLHKLIDSLPYLEDLLNVFCSNSQATKAFLFDTHSRLYVATDASPVDPPTHNLCSDYLQTLNAFGPLYKSISASPSRMYPPRDPPATAPPPSSTGPSAPASPRPPAAASTAASHPATRAHSPALSSHRSPQISDSILQQPITTSPDAIPPPTLPPSLSSQSLTSAPPSPASPPQQKPRFYPSAAASLAPTAAGAGTTLTYHLVAPGLALLALIPSGVFAARRGLVEYNVVFFREGVQEICAVEREARKVPVA
ncbi:Gtr1/RagA G protein conserved region-domain-containing protein [Trametes polyzona]|nr:Gtr1/RagA G protein conserved region-domain-containing protein [Trametes polyzona]